MKNISMHDIARITGYSISTVSKALNGSYKDINQKTRDVICEVAKSYSYSPNQLASAMARKRSNNIGVVIPNILNPFFAEFVRGVEDYAYQNGINTILCNTDDDLGKEDQYLVSMTKGMIDGAIITPSEGRRAGYSHLVPQGFPIVILGDVPFGDETYRFVKTDNRLGASTAVKYLVDMGHREILFIGGSRNNLYSQARLQGYKEALQENGITVDEEKIFCGMLRSEWGQEAIETAIRGRIRFSAVFCANDMTAYGAMNAIEAHSLRIPDDISIIGFDDLNIISSNIKLTTMRQPKHAMGQAAAEMLIRLIEGQGVQDKIMEPRLVPRSSVRKLTG